jgi:hypothetical protein
MSEKPAQDEELITKILTTPKTRAVKAMLEKDHAIDCLFLLHMDKGRWKQAKAFMNKNGLTLSDGTYRSRMIEIEHNGYATSTQLDPLKKHYHITAQGKKLTQALLQLLQKL